MKWIVKIKNSRWIFPFVAGIVCTVIIGSVVYSIQRLKEKKKVQAADPNIIAPYYQKKDFQLPEGIKSIASTSATVKIPIIMYHYVEYVKDANDIIRKKLNINPYLFEGHIRSLEETRYKTYFVRDIPDILDGKIKYSTRSAVLTFDDGYEDFYSVVFPLLKKYQMKATMYIVYDFIGRKGFMNEEEIKEIMASGLVELGAHTLDHLYLKFLPENTQRKQIIESKKKLEELFGIQVKTFAYPYGAFSEETVNLVKEAGYTVAVSVIPGMQQSTDNILYLSRVRPGIFTPQTIVKVIEDYKK